MNEKKLNKKKSLEKKLVKVILSNVKNVLMKTMLFRDKVCQTQKFKSQKL